VNTVMNRQGPQREGISWPPEGPRTSQELYYVKSVR
jgi:hypothetical protein